jgi:VanZ family protein
MNSIFLPDSGYKKQSRFIAMLWTLLIFTGCLYPGRELPHVDVPLIDKWTHFVMFGLFGFLWLCAYPGGGVRNMVKWLVVTVAMGAVTELLQGMLTFLGRSMERTDLVADALGALLGVGMFAAGAAWARSRTT